MRSSLAAIAIALSVLATEASAHAKPDDPPSTAQEREAREKSRTAFRAGVSQLQAKDWKAARSSFEVAYTLYPHPSILLNRGIARLRTDDPVLAEQDFKAFLSEDFGATPEELGGAREALAEARTKIGTIRVVASPPSSRIVVDGTTIGERVTERDSAVAEVRAKAGKHTVLVDAEGHAAQERNIDLAPRAEIEVKIALVANAKVTGSGRGPGPTGGDDGTSGRTILGYGLLGLSGIALATTAVCGFRAISLSGDYEDRNKPDLFQNPEVKAEGETFRTVADIALGAAVVSGVGAIVLLLTDVGSSKPTASKRAPLLLRW